MNWLGPALTADQRDLVAMLDALAADRGVLPSDERPAEVTDLVGELAELGIWTVGTPEAMGGGGADETTTALAHERLGRHWPALGWASVQAHAAVSILSADERCHSLVRDLHAGRAAVALVESDSIHVGLAWRDDQLVGTVDRVDAGHPDPWLLLLEGDSALLLAPTVTSSTPVRRSGLDGSFCRSLEIGASREAVLVIQNADVSRARGVLMRGAGAVAAGIAGIAAEQARIYAGERHQFGDVLTAIPTVRRSLADQAGLASAVLHAVIGAGDPFQISAALRSACDAAVTTAAAALQSHGGYGYLVEYPAERHLRDAVTLRAACGAYAIGGRAAAELVGRADPLTSTLATS